MTQETVSTLQIQQIFLHLYQRHMNENQVPAVSQDTEEHEGTSTERSSNISHTEAGAQVVFLIFTA